MSINTKGRETARIDVAKVLQSIWKPQVIDLPAFANDANLKLHEDIKAASFQISQLIQELSGADAHVTNIDNHKDIVLKELSHAQELIDAKQKEVESEVHLTNLYERDIGRMKQKVIEITKQSTEIEDRKQQLQTQLLRQNAKLTELTKEQQWLLDDQQQWKLAHEHKMEDQFSLEKYKAIDDKTLQEANQAVDRQLKIINDLQKQLNDEIQNTQTIQLQLDKTADQFKNLQQQREFSLNQLQQSLEVLEQREKESVDAEQIRDRLEMEVNYLKQQDRELQQEIDKFAKELTNSEHDYEQAEREVQWAQSELDQAREDMKNLEGEIQVDRGQISTLNRQINQSKDAFQSQLQQKQARQEALNIVQKRIDLFNSASGKMLENKEEIEAIIQRERDTVDLLNEQLNQWNKILGSVNSDLMLVGKYLHELKEEESTLKSSISSYQAGLKGLENRIATMENQLQQQRRHIYNADFQIQALTRKLSHVRGDISAEEQLVLKKNIDTLKNQLSIETKGVKLVKQQTGSVLAEIGRVKRQLAEAAGQKARIENVLNELQLAAKTQIYVVQQTTDEKQENLLQLDNLKITREQIFQQFNQQMSILFGLQNRGNQIDIQQQAKQKELEVTKAVMQNQLRLLRDEVHYQRLELKQRRIASSKLECRCSVLVARVASMASQAKGGDSVADPRTAQADAIISFSKKVQELMQRKAELQQKEQKIRQQKKGLKQALLALKQSNNAVRKLGRPAEQHSKDELKDHKAKLAQVETQMFYYVSQTRQAMQKMDELAQQNDLMREEIDRMAGEFEGIQNGDM